MGLSEYMVKVDIKNNKGELVGTQELPESIFAKTKSGVLVSEVARAMMANLRRPYAHTKTRGEVRGGGRKPWRQKGTGKARHGSIRSPIWKGGGVTFGPRKERNYLQKINDKARKLSLKIVLGDRAKNNCFRIIESWGEIARTKQAHEFLKNLKLADKKVLILSDDSSLQRAFKNIPKAETSMIKNLNTLKALEFEHILISSCGLKELNTWLESK